MSLHQRSTRQRGFTLIELVVVLVIIGILAAFAIPRFINIATDARKSALNGITGTMRSTASLVHGLALAHGNTGAAGSESLEGQAVTTAFGYPTADGAGIIAAMNNLDPNTYDHTEASGVITVTVKTATTPANCSVQYTQPASAGAAGVVSTPTDTGC